MQPTIKALILSDWAPHIEKTVRLICVPIAAAYVAGYMVGRWIHQLNDALTALAAPRPTAPTPAPVLYRCAPVVARCGFAHDRRAQRGASGIQAPDPMAKAIAAVMGGSSQAAAARMFNVSRSTLRRRLAK